MNNQEFTSVIKADVQRIVTKLRDEQGFDVQTVSLNRAVKIVHDMLAAEGKTYGHNKIYVILGTLLGKEYQQRFNKGKMY